MGSQFLRPSGARIAGPRCNGRGSFLSPCRPAPNCPGADTDNRLTVSGFPFLRRLTRRPSSDTTWDFLCLGYLLSPFRHARPLISTSDSLHFRTGDRLDSSSSPLTLLSPPSSVRRTRILVISKVLVYDSDIGDRLLRFSSEEG